MIIKWIRSLVDMHGGAMIDLLLLWYHLWVGRMQQQGNNHGRGNGRGGGGNGRGRGRVGTTSGAGSSGGGGGSTNPLHPGFLIGAPPLMDHTRTFLCPPGSVVQEVWDKTLVRINAIESSKWSPAMSNMLERFKSKVTNIVVIITVCLSDLLSSPE